MATELEKLIGFLTAPSPPVKKAAVDIVRGLTGSEDGLHSLSNYANTVFSSFSQFWSDEKVKFQNQLLKLLYPSQNAGLAAKMVEMRMIKIAMDLLYKPGCSITRLLVMLLVNLTQLDDGISSLLQIGDDKMQELYVMKLVRSFCRSSETSDDPFDHVGSILINISKKEEGRKMLLDPKRGLLKQIVRQFDSSSPLVKQSYIESTVLRGLLVGFRKVSGTIRNCCFEAENQLQNLLLISEFLWPALLLPVAGNKIYSEQDTSKMPLELGSALSVDREVVKDPRDSCSSTGGYLLDCSIGRGRRALWSVNGPRILQVGYEDEEDPKVMEAYEQIGQSPYNRPRTVDPTLLGFHPIFPAASNIYRQIWRIMNGPDRPRPKGGQILAQGLETLRMALFSLPPASAYDDDRRSVAVGAAESGRF
ncbi:ARM repeat superfamily protein isoform 3 [Hibiscus syriacus]|uniref:Protein HGH1 homolog n=1 Tax=Hibiscus syriacus TaxID=106335 RepID=A0A6A3C764_HIBSY|nr:ARM repeat superfamily protein isoform 3 [Hibiscus syriacus]